MRENAVFAVHTSSGARVALRVHRLGYHGNEALQSELQWMQALRAAGIEVPHVVPSRAGRIFELVDCPGVPGPRQVDMFEWIDGHQLGSVEKGLEEGPDSAARVYHTLGELAARMHNQACKWRPPQGFQRHAWDLNGLLGEQPLWGRFWEYEGLSARQRALLQELRVCAVRDLTAYGDAADRYSLIHADLVGENVLVDTTGLRVIDFDDCGFGWHLFELATSLYFIRNQDYFEVARDALLAGYRRYRALPDEHVRLLSLFMAIRGTTYLGWMHTRSGEAAAHEIAPQLIELAEAAATEYFSNAG